MKKFLFILALLLALPGGLWADSYTRVDCDTLTGVAIGDDCLQTSDVNGRLAGRTYAYNGSAWIEKAAPSIVNAQTGTTYTVLNSDSRKLVTFTNGSAIAVTLPQAGASSAFMSGWFVDVQNRGAGTATITPTTSTIDGAASIALTQNQGIRIFSDGTNYFTQRGIGGAGGGSAGDLTEVQGTTNEITVTSGTGPVPIISLPATVNLSSKALVIPGKTTATAPTAAGSVARLTDGGAVGAIVMGDGTTPRCAEQFSLKILIDVCPPFNAKNDGSDDTAAIQAMLTALESTGGTIIKTGLSTITSALTYTGPLQQKLYVIGTGIDPGFRWNGALAGTMFQSIVDTDKTSIHLWNLRWVSADTAHRAGKAIHLKTMGSASVVNNKFDEMTDAIYLQGVLLSSFDQNLFYGVRGDCLSMHLGGSVPENNGNWITRNEFYFCGNYAINATNEVTNNGNVIQNNSFEGQVSTSLGSIYGALSRGLIANNRFEDTCLNLPDFRPIILPGVNMVTIAFNDFGECGSTDYHIEVKLAPNELDVSNDIRLIGNVFANAGTLGNVKMSQVLGSNFYSIGDAHNTSNAIVGDTAKLWSVVGWGTNIIDTHTIRLQQPSARENYTGLPSLYLNGKRFANKTNQAIPTSGTWQKGDFVYSAIDTLTPTNLVDEHLMWWIVTSGTMGTLVGETGGITIGTTTLTMTAGSSLSVGDMITIAGVSGVKTIVTKTSTTIFEIDTTANATVAGAAVAYSPAVWEAVYPLRRATPASAAASGAAGMTAIDANYYYWYTGGAWKRAPGGWDAHAFPGALSAATIGVGTTPPSATLGVTGNIQALDTTNTNTIYGNNQNTAGGRGVVASATGLGAGTNVGLYVVANNGAVNQAIYVPLNLPPAGANNYALNVESEAKSYFAGSVGIGTPTPGVKLDVVGTINATTGFQVGGAALNYSHLAGATKSAQVSVFDPTVTVTTGDGLAYFVIPPSMNGMNLVGVRAHVNTVSSSGVVTIDIARCAVVATGNTCSGTVVAPLSTKLTIDANESKSATAAVPAVIDTANDDVATDQVYRLDVDTAGTGTLGLIMLMEFALP